MTQEVTAELKALGHKVTEFSGLDTFAHRDSLAEVVMTSDEVTAMCPVTGQPDWYTVTIKYIPGGLCIESKTLKLLLHSLRNVGMFCENLSSHILDIITSAINPKRAEVTVIQKPRGGISIVATSKYTREG